MTGYDPNKTRYDFLNSLPPHEKARIQRVDIYTDFLLSYLIRKGGVAKIDQLVLDVNKADVSLKSFLKQQEATERGFAEVVKKTKKYTVFKMTQEGLDHFDYISTKYRTKSPTLIKRMSLYVLKLIRNLWSIILKVWSFVFVSANNRIKTIMESGIAKLILFTIAVLSFVMKDELKEIIKKLFNL